MGTVGLAVVDPPFGAQAWLDALESHQLKATFFVRPYHLVGEMPLWRKAISEGHELGNGALLGVTDDGRLRNWSCEALEAELREGDQLIRDLGQAEVNAVALPGRFHVCGEGRYAPKIRSAFAFCLGEAERLTYLNGQSGHVSFSGSGEDRPSVLFLHPSAADLTFLLPHALAVGAKPLRDLLQP